MTDLNVKTIHIGPTGLSIAKDRFLKSQLVELYEIIKESNLNPSDFTWKIAAGPPGQWHINQPRLVHVPSGFHCNFYFHTDNSTRAMTFTPGSVNHVENPGGVDWPRQKEHTRNWLSNIKREIESPDVWEIGEQEREALASSPSLGSDNSPFTAEEKVKVYAKLEELKQYLLTAHRLDPELVEARMQYLTGAVDRLGRTDWKGVVLATIIGLLTEAAASTETFHDVFRFVGGLLHEIFTNTPLLSN